MRVARIIYIKKTRVVLFFSSAAARLASEFDGTPLPICILEEGDRYERDISRQIHCVQNMAIVFWF